MFTAAKFDLLEALGERIPPPKVADLANFSQAPVLKWKNIRRKFLDPDQDQHTSRMACC